MNVLLSSQPTNKGNETMTVKEMSAFIDCIALYPVKGIEFGVRIKDIKSAPYGRIDVLIVPLSGRDSMWVSLSSIRIMPKD